MGRRAIDKLNSQGINVMLLKGNTVKEAISLFEKGELEKIDPDSACQGHGCH
jgi:predicted Fe-Mo cluster-binding NifX family protein